MAGPTPMITTERLVLRPFDAGDEDAYARLVGNPVTMRHIGDGAPLTCAAAWSQLAYLIGHWHLRGHGLFAVVRRRDEAVIGRVGTLQPADLADAELGWLLEPDAWGQGLGREAVAAALGWAFSSAGLPRLVSWIVPENRRARRLAEALGAAPVGQADRHGRRFNLYRFDPPSPHAG